MLGHAAGLLVVIRSPGTRVVSEPLSAQVTQDWDDASPCIPGRWQLAAACTALVTGRLWDSSARSQSSAEFKLVSMWGS